MNKLTEQIQAEVNKVVLGKEDIVRKVLLAILAQGHVLLEDVPGVGKTTLAKAFSKTLGLDSRRVQFTSDTLPSDIIGFSVFDKRTPMHCHRGGAKKTVFSLERRGGLRRADGEFLPAVGGGVSFRILSLVGHGGSRASGAGGAVCRLPERYWELGRSRRDRTAASAEPGAEQVDTTRLRRPGK